MKSRAQDTASEVHEVSREQQRLLDGAGDFIPDEFLGAGVTVALAAGYLGADTAKEAALGEFALGWRGAALGTGIGSIDTGHGSAVGAREGLEKDFA